MKRFFITTFALTLFSTASVFGAGHTSNNDIYSFLTINGKPIKEYSQNNSQNNDNNNSNINICNPNNNINNNTSNKPNNNMPNNPNNNVDDDTSNKPSKPNNTLPQEPNKPIKPSNPIENENNVNNNTSIITQEVVKLVNIERQKAGLTPLKIDQELSKVAMLKSEDMKKKGYFSHTSPTYGTPFDMLKQFNIKYTTAGENIAKGQKTAEAVVDAWMNSDGHRRNILSKSFTHIGVGFYANHWTQLFISK